MKVKNYPQTVINPVLILREVGIDSNMKFWLGRVANLEKNVVRGIRLLDILFDKKRWRSEMNAAIKAENFSLGTSLYSPLCHVLGDSSNLSAINRIAPSNIKKGERLNWGRTHGFLAVGERSRFTTKIMNELWKYYINVAPAMLDLVDTGQDQTREVDKVTFNANFKSLPDSVDVEIPGSIIVSHYSSGTLRGLVRVGEGFSFSITY